jgi:hypothetical protein
MVNGWCQRGGCFKAFCLLLGIPMAMCRGVFIGENAHKSCATALHLQANASGLVDFCGEERGGVEGGFFAAEAAEIELVTAHGHADAAFDAGGHFGE